MTIQIDKHMKKFFGRLLPALFACIVIMLIMSVTPVLAQQGGQQQTQGEQQPQSPQLTQQDSLTQAYKENQTLEAIMHSINSIDTARQNELIQWIITDRTVRSRVISALRKAGFQIAPNSIAEMTVTQVPPNDLNEYQEQLLRIVIANVGVYGQPMIQHVLGPSLYNEINSHTPSYEYTLISTEPEQEKIQFLAVNASLFGGDIIFKSGFGFGVNVGDDAIGYPFWLPGTIGTYGLVRNGTTDFRIGIEWPLGASGFTPFSLSQGLQIRERKLAGAMAFAAEVKQDLGLLPEQSGKLHFGLEFRDAFTPAFSQLPGYQGMTGNNGQYETYFEEAPVSLSNLDPGPPGSPAHAFIYYLALSAHGYVGYKLPDQTLKGGYIQVGGGTHSIQPLTIGNDVNDKENINQQNLVLWNRLNFIDPFIKLGYVHTAETGDQWGVSVQYSNELLTDAWVQLFSWFQLEAKYATVIGRDPYPWEWKDYVMVSPKIILNF